MAKLRLIIWRNFIPLIKVSFRFFFKRWGGNPPYTRKPRRRLNRSGFITILLLKRSAILLSKSNAVLSWKRCAVSFQKQRRFLRRCSATLAALPHRKVAKIRLTLRELASSTCFLKTIFLSFLHTRVSCQETCRLKCWSVRFFVSLA